MGSDGKLGCESEELLLMVKLMSHSEETHVECLFIDLVPPVSSILDEIVGLCLAFFQGPISKRASVRAKQSNVEI